MRNGEVHYAGAPSLDVVEVNQGENPGGVVNSMAMDEILAYQLQEMDLLDLPSPPNELSDELPIGSSLVVGESSQTVNRGEEPTQDDVDPDNSSYEELVAIGEAVGAESRGLTDELISYLNSSKYKTCILFPNKTTYEDCSICLEGVKNRDRLIHLPCQHTYHAKCIRPWLKDDRRCPMCNYEVFGPK